MQLVDDDEVEQQDLGKKTPESDIYSFAGLCYEVTRRCEANFYSSHTILSRFLLANFLSMI